MSVEILFVLPLLLLLPSLITLIVSERPRGKVTGTIMLFLVFIIFAFGMFASSKEVTTNELKSVEHIVALQDSTGIEGEFHSGLFATTGYIDDVLYYYYIVDCGDYKVVNKIKAASTRIYECDDDFRVEWRKNVSDWWIFHDEDQEFTWRIYIPKNSITSGFKIDLN